MFTKGAIYNRKEHIHAVYGGNPQSGIVPVKNDPYIFLFSSLHGEEFGYKDGWNEHGDYLYSGEGQTGNQEFVRGNRAIRDHMANGKELHLFERHDARGYKYVGRFAFVSFTIVTAEDVNGSKRKLIKFLLRNR